MLAFYENSHEARCASTTAAGCRATPAVERHLRRGALRHYVAAGPAAPPPRALRRADRPPAPAPALGPRLPPVPLGLQDEDDVREVAAGFAAEGLPLSAIHLDIDYMDGYRVFTVDRHRFPDLAGLAEDLAARGTPVVTIIDPAVKADPGYDVYRQGRRRRPVRARRRRAHPPRRRCGRAGPPSPTSPTRRPGRWWGGWYRAARRRGGRGLARHERAHLDHPVGGPHPAHGHPPRRRGTGRRPPGGPQRLRPA